ncbi:MAG: hypoxanthine-guanine phosphoribosyltransferase, partial [Proteobacteria bacterium]|nr:hypoxanthine-guanine phosphoribosyltransferase [Pseudomonadota bacterium]
MQQLPKNSKVLVNRKTINQAIDQIANQINNDYNDKSVLFLTVMNGGMLFAAELSQKLDIDMEMDYLQLSRYGKNSKGGQLIWKYQPEIELSGKHVILCDDIYDEGHTLAADHNWGLKKGA